MSQYQQQQPYPPYGQPGYAQPGYAPQFGGYPAGAQPPPPGFAMPGQQPPKYGDPYVGYSSGGGAGGSHNVNIGTPNDTDVNNWAGFTDKNIRRMFVQKVYSILSLQLFVTFGITAIVVLTIVFFTLYITLMCCKGPRRNYPTNFILLSLFTVALSFMVAMICSFHDLTSVLIAAGITALCCTAVSVLSFWTKVSIFYTICLTIISNLLMTYCPTVQFDFTRFGWALGIASLGLFIMGICMIFIKVKILYIVYAGLGTVIFMLFLAYDTQLITGGKKYEISPEEYILASIMLYVDIVYIFLMILQLVSAGRD
ncbi:unnamed protein product [Oppiella nova]|uniref:Uncharacterized protein n=1 Tax=Oppiella nova TaxID=334625 RepID=A0A7R9M961_9ACAR|nr:unnamed protein product [Oppiella nova]CAG2171793.1 unnamed protein product [Oppiella nova]